MLIGLGGGLGYARFGQNDTGPSGVYDWNEAASRGGHDVRPFAVKGKYRSARDRQFALDLWKLQHEQLRCSGSGRINDAHATDCDGRDGIYGQQTQQMVANKVIAGNTDWTRNITLHPSLIAAGHKPIPSLRCADINCAEKVKFGCPPCGVGPGPRPGPRPDPQPGPKQAGLGLVLAGAAILVGAYFYTQNKA